MIVIDSCQWDHPGNSPYHGTSEAAIMSLATLPLDARKRLVIRGRDSYDYVVTVDKNSVTSRDQPFEREVAMMNFGDGSKLCGDVKRDNWTDDHVETAIVYCDGEGYCVGKFSVCGNWAIFTRSVAPTRPPILVPPVEAAPPDALPPVVLPPVGAPGAPPLGEGPPLTFYGGGGGGYGGGFGGGFGGGGGGGYSPCPTCQPAPYCPPITTPVPEPTTLASLAAGLALLYIRRKKTA